MLFFLVFIVTPFLVLYLAIKKRMGIKAINWASLQSTKKSWHNYFFYSALFTLLFFSAAFGLWIYLVTKNNSDIDNSGMALIIFVPPVIMTVILLLSGAYTRFYCYKRNVKVDYAAFVLLGVLTVPVSLFGLLSIVAVVLLAIELL